MAPQTRSTTKLSSGRSTRNSVYGRSPLPPPKPRKSLGSPSTAQTAQAQNERMAGNVAFNDDSGKGTPWLACRDAHGVMTTVAVSETGEGIHVRWYYPEDECEAEEGVEVDGDDVMSVDDERGVTPTVTVAGPCQGDRHPFPETPMAPWPYDAGSVIQTPVKRAKPLQRSPLRIGDKGVRCLYEKEGVLRDMNGVARVVLRHPIGSAANLSREQVERLENERERKIVQVQVERLLAEKKRIEELEDLSDSGYEEEMETDVVFEERFRGPGGEVLDRHGRQMLGREGTILIDSTYALPKRLARDASVGAPATPVAHERRKPVRFGPEGTELIVE